MNYSEQILKARFEQLPKDVKKAIMATPWEEKLNQISNKHSLHIDQAGHLGEETVLVMFGIEHTDSLIPNIVKHVEVSEEKAEAIAEDLNREIFLKVRESLKKIFEEKKSDIEEIPSREDILREIEDKEHHELHLDVSFPSELAVKQPDEIMILTENTHLETKQPGPNNIIKDKMSGIVNIPKETIVIEDSPSPLKTTQPNTEGKTDPYRERTG